MDGLVLEKAYEYINKNHITTITINKCMRDCTFYTKQSCLKRLLIHFFYIRTMCLIYRRLFSNWPTPKKRSMRAQHCHLTVLSKTAFCAQVECAKRQQIKWTFLFFSDNQQRQRTTYLTYPISIIRSKWGCILTCKHMYLFILIMERIHFAALMSRDWNDVNELICYNLTLASLYRLGSNRVLWYEPSRTNIDISL